MKVILPAQVDKDAHSWVDLDGKEVMVSPLHGATYQKELADLSPIEIEWLVNERMRLVERIARIRSITLAV